MMNDRNLSAMIVVTTDELVESCLKEFEKSAYREFAVHGVVVVEQCVREKLSGAFRW